MSVFSPILYIKDTISMLGWKLWPLPTCTVTRHLHWQCIHLKFGTRLLPKCRSYYRHERTHTPPPPPPPPPWQQNRRVVQHGLRGSEARGTAVWTHAREWTFGGGHTRRFDVGIWRLKPSGLWFYMWRDGLIFICGQGTHTNTDSSIQCTDHICLTDKSRSVRRSAKSYQLIYYVL